MKSWLAVSCGEVADQERKHSGEEASEHLGASEKEASGIRGARLFERAFQAWIGPEIAWFERSRNCSE